jgi:hypothetical protein
MTENWPYYFFYASPRIAGIDHILFTKKLGFDMKMKIFLSCPLSSKN